MSPPIRLAIIGGGLAGATLAHALLKHPHILFNVYESKATFTESGYGVGLGPKAIAALEHIGPEMKDTLTASGAHQDLSQKIVMAVGPEKGTLIYELPGNVRIQRSRWLAELLKPVPRERLHPGKKLVDIHADDAASGPFTLLFADGSQHEADAIIGADGLHSHLRRFVLGPASPALAPVFSGAHTARFALPLAAAAPLFGDALFDPREPSMFFAVGGGAFFMHSLMDDGQTCNFAAAFPAHPDTYAHGAYKTPLARAQLEQQLAQWDPRFARAMVDSLLASGAENYALMEHPPTPTYVRGRVLIVGDAAHSTTPWQGNGGGMAVEDAAMLAALLARAPSAAPLARAFAIFDALRRPRCEAIVRSSHAVGAAMLDARSSDPAAFRAALQGRWDHILELDVAAHIAEAVRRLEEGEGEV